MRTARARPPPAGCPRGPAARACGPALAPVPPARHRPGRMPPPGPARGRPRGQTGESRSVRASRRATVRETEGWAILHPMRYLSPKPPVDVHPAREAPPPSHVSTQSDSRASVTDVTLRRPCVGNIDDRAQDGLLQRDTHLSSLPETARHKRVVSLKWARQRPAALGPSAPPWRARVSTPAALPLEVLGSVGSSGAPMA